MNMVSFEETAHASVSSSFLTRAMQVCLMPLSVINRTTWGRWSYRGSLSSCPVNNTFWLLLIKIPIGLVALLSSHQSPWPLAHSIGSILDPHSFLHLTCHFHELICMHKWCIVCEWALSTEGKGKEITASLQCLEIEILEIRWRRNEIKQQFKALCLRDVIFATEKLDFLGCF